MPVDKGYVKSLDTSTLRQWLEIITLDRLVVETDAPYMGTLRTAPQRSSLTLPHPLKLPALHVCNAGWKGCRNTETKGKDRKYPNVPAALVGVVDCIQEASPGWSREDIVRKTTTNALVHILNCGWLQGDVVDA